MDALQKRWWENHAKYVELETRKKNTMYSCKIYSLNVGSLWQNKHAGTVLTCSQDVKCCVVGVGGGW